MRLTMLFTGAAALATAITIYTTHSNTVPDVTPINDQMAQLDEPTRNFAKRYITAVQSSHHDFRNADLIEKSTCVALDLTNSPEKPNAIALQELAVLSVQEAKTIRPHAKRKIEDLISQHRLAEEERVEISSKLFEVTQKCAATEWHAKLDINRT